MDLKLKVNGFLIIQIFKHAANEAAYYPPQNFIFSYNLDHHKKSSKIIVENFC